jgi:epoxyqueuosine reductase
VAYLKQVLDKETRLENWLKNNSNGQMTYMENHFDKRLNQRYLLMEPKCRLVLLNYTEQLQNSDTLKYQNMLMVQITIL